MKLKIKILTEEEIKILPYPETARIVGGILIMEETIDQTVIENLLREWTYANEINDLKNKS